ALWWRLASRRLRTITPTQVDYGEPAGLRVLREAVAAHVQAARGTRCGAEQILIVAGAQQGLELISRGALDPGRRGWGGGPGYPGARRAVGGGGACGGGGRGAPPRRAARVRDAVAPVPPGRPDEPDAAARPAPVGEPRERLGRRGRLRQRVSLRVKAPAAPSR